MERAKNRTKSRVRSKVEHVFASDEAEVRIVKLRTEDEEECQPTVAVCGGEGPRIGRNADLLIIASSSNGDNDRSLLTHWRQVREHYPDP